MPKERGQNEGAVYEAKDRPGFRGFITLPSGKKKYFSGKTKPEVRRKVAAALHALKEGALPMGPRQTVEQYLTKWLETSKRRVRPRTYERYERDVRVHIIPGIGKHILEKLTAEHLQLFYNAKSDSGLAARTVGHMHRIIHRALNDAMRMDLVPRNVADLVDPPRTSRPDIRTLKPDEAQHLLHVAKGHRLEALWILALTTGARQEELLGLKWDCVDLANGSIEIRRTVCFLRGHSGPVWDEPKNDTSRRKVSLAPIAIDALHLHRERQVQQRAFAGEKWEEQELVFPNTQGRPIDASNLTSQQFYPLLAKAGLPRVRFHDLRHSAATLLFSMDTHPKIVQELLGHSSIKVTMDTYSHAIPTLQSGAVNRLGDLLQGAGKPAT